MQLSRFFTLAEMTRSDTATRLGIANQPDEPALAGLKALCAAVLDPLRESTGAPINVSSGYRGPELNARIGGAKKSQHMEGRAADIQSHGMSVLDLFKAVIRLGLPFDQVIYEAKSRTSKWVHVSHDPDRPGGSRGAILLADFSPDGKVARYRTITAQEALDLTESATRSAGTELEYEEMPDEPEVIDEIEAALEEMPAPPRAVPHGKPRRKTRAKGKAKRKAQTKAKAGPRARRKVAARRKAEAPRARSTRRLAGNRASRKSASRRKPAPRRARAKARKGK